MIHEYDPRIFHDFTVTVLQAPDTAGKYPQLPYRSDERYFAKLRERSWEKRMTPHELDSLALLRSHAPGIAKREMENNREAVKNIAAATAFMQSLMRHDDNRYVYVLRQIQNQLTMWDTTLALMLLSQISMTNAQPVLTRSDTPITLGLDTTDEGMKDFLRKPSDLDLPHAEHALHIHPVHTFFGMQRHERLFIRERVDGEHGSRFVESIDMAGALRLLNAPDDGSEDSAAEWDALHTRVERIVSLFPGVIQVYP